MKKNYLPVLFILFFSSYIFAQNVGIGTTTPQGELHVSRPYQWQGITFTGTGLDDMSANHDSYTGTTERTYTIKVSNAGPDPNWFDWTDDGSNWTTNVAMSTSPVSLSNGISVYWSQTSGHTYDDQWSFTIGPDYPDGLIVKNAQVGIGTTTPDATAKLDIVASDKGVLIPRTDTSTLNAAGSPATGLTIYQTSDNKYYYYDGDKWVVIAAGTNPVFERNGTTIRQISGYDTDDFILGRDLLPQNGESIKDTMFFFDKSKASLRFGRLDNSLNWSPDSIGFGSFASGYNTKAKGRYASAWGGFSDASGSYSTAWGKVSEASGYAATAWGKYSVASGDYATVWGEYTDALGDYSSAWGCHSNVSGDYATAWGFHSNASGDYATAWGFYTKTPSYLETALGRNNIDYTPNSSTAWNSNDRLFSIGNGTTISNRNNALTVMKNGNMGISRNVPDTELDIEDSKDADFDVHLRLRSHYANGDAIIEFYEDTTDAAMSIHYDGGLNKLYFKDLTASPAEIRVSINRSNGSMIPGYHKVSDLGAFGKAWDDIYYDDLHNQGASAFIDRSPTLEILSYPPQGKKPGDFDYRTDRGDIELDPKSMPPGLADDNSLLTDEISSYNYKTNYEQQVIIKNLESKIEEQDKKLNTQESKINKQDKEIKSLKSRLEAIEKMLKKK